MDVEKHGAGEGSSERGHDGGAEREVGDEVAWSKEVLTWGMRRGLGFINLEREAGVDGIPSMTST